MDDAILIEKYDKEYRGLRCRKLVAICIRLPQRSQSTAIHAHRHAFCAAISITASTGVMPF